MAALAPIPVESYDDWQDEEEKKRQRELAAQQARDQAETNPVPDAVPAPSSIFQVNSPPPTPAALTQGATPSSADGAQTPESAPSIFQVSAPAPEAQAPAPSSSMFQIDAPPPSPSAPTNSAAPAPGAWTFPVQGYSGKVDLHWGEHAGAADLFAKPGTPVLAAAGGRVLDAGYSDIGGNNVLIQGADGNQYYYAHLQETPLVKPGQVVEAGAQLGGVGDTGNAKGTGAHLHFGAGPTILNGSGPAGGAGGGGFDTVGRLNAALTGVSNVTSPGTASSPRASLPPIDKSNPSAFIASVTPYAEQVQAETGIPASIMVGIAANETGYGKHASGNNFFGIKGSNPNTGATFSSPTWEVENAELPAGNNLSVQLSQLQQKLQMNRAGWDKAKVQLQFASWKVQLVIARVLSSLGARVCLMVGSGYCAVRTFFWLRYIGYKIAYKFGQNFEKLSEYGLRTLGVDPHERGGNFPLKAFVILTTILLSSVVVVAYLVARIHIFCKDRFPPLLLEIVEWPFVTVSKLINDPAGVAYNLGFGIYNIGESLTAHVAGSMDEAAVASQKKYIQDKIPTLKDGWCQIVLNPPTVKV